jgi:hypothetical protein
MIDNQMAMIRRIASVYDFSLSVRYCSIALATLLNT